MQDYDEDGRCHGHSGDVRARVRGAKVLAVAERCPGRGDDVDEDNDATCLHLHELHVRGRG